MTISSNTSRKALAGLAVGALTVLVCTAALTSSNPATAQSSSGSTTQASVSETVQVVMTADG